MILIRSCASQHLAKSIVRLTQQLDEALRPISDRRLVKIKVLQDCVAIRPGSGRRLYSGNELLQS